AGEVRIFHAGTTSTEAGLVTSGGRVLNIVGIGTDVAAARDTAYAAAGKIEFDGKHFRTDIGERVG
ncbi:MAG: phosphoribosylamine--glycine ligase, partial [Actinobacteria bacterium]|nr:phosphoribosylamine--glycine ligase [Actinomycetota bacterium]NIS36884.1 phosphoribosylamine--glycine ligase [Actinomycetota bacterium]NIV90774.1 phosphoribosylamine--glycine ligase [Actinomycetota bacterium]NIX22136.1 phosphoribosylamine--glycine ligase [Actinomycetota bacterium]